MSFQVFVGEPWPRVSVVIPAMNEARNLPHVFERIPASVYEVILVGGYSVDDTVAVARQLRPDVRVVTQNRKRKGNALACGFAAAAGSRCRSRSLAQAEAIAVRCRPLTSGSLPVTTTSTTTSSWPIPS